MNNDETTMFISKNNIMNLSKITKKSLKEIKKSIMDLLKRNNGFITSVA